MTKRMLEVLEQIRQQPARRVSNPGPGQPAWPHNPSTLAALTRRELVQRGERLNRKGHPLVEWTITELGRQALEPVRKPQVDRPLFLAAGRHDYTNDPRRSIDLDQAPGSKVATAVEVLVAPAHLAAYAQRAADRRHARALAHGQLLDQQDPRQRIERLADHPGAHVARELRLIEHMLGQGRELNALTRLTALEAALAHRAAA